MNRLILDPSLFEISEDANFDVQLEHFHFLAETIDFVASFVNGALDEYNGAPYSYYFEETADGQNYQAPPITHSLIIRNKYVTIKKNLLKLLSQGRFVDLPDSTISRCSLQLDLDSVTANAFKKYLYFLLTEDSSCSHFLILLSKANEHSAPLVTVFFDGIFKGIQSISNPAVDCHQVISAFLNPCNEENDLFPQKASCSQLNSHFILHTIRLELSQKRAAIISYGRETASRNHYTQESSLSRKNPQYIVYVHKSRQYFLSIDLEHGGLEMFKLCGSHAMHIGEYDYSGNLSKPAQPQTHQLIL